MRSTLVIGLAAVLAGGCGGAAGTHRATATPSAPATPIPATAQLHRGGEVFAGSCSACHGLTGQEDPRRQGGDLAKFTMTEAQIESETRVMPARRPLSEAEVRAVSRYVLAAQRAYAARHPGGR